jgi:hypothetical protein
MPQWKITRERLIYPGIPIATIVLGIAYMVLSYVFELRWAHELLTELSYALIIFGLLGLSLEVWMRQAFARDIFRAAFGYHMPPDFKDEISRIAEQRIICIKHIMDVKIREVGKESVRVTFAVERHLRNIGNYSAGQKAYLELDDWGFNEPATILKCEVHNANGTRQKTFDPTKIKYEPDFRMIAETEPLSLRPRETVCVVYEYNVIKRKNDQFIEWWLCPTRNPEVRISEMPKALDVTVSFGGIKQPKRTYIPYRYELDGVYFPPAAMKVRWWLKTASWPPKSGGRCTDETASATEELRAAE